MRSLFTCALLIMALGCGDNAPEEMPDASSAPDSSTPDSSTPDSSTPDASVAPEALCFAAATESACDAIDLPQQEDCDDCWHRCTWVPLHEVELVDGACSYGASSGACTYQRGGEDDTEDLARACNGTGSSTGTFWIDRSGDEPRVGFIGTGFLMYPELERCGFGDDLFALAPECQCPCLPDYPGAECSPIAQGLTQCPGVPRHRVEAAACAEEPEGSDCTNDGDCAEGEACVCGGSVGPNVCVPSRCATDSDCEGDDVCALSIGADGDLSTCEPKALACRAPYVDCDGTRCATDQLCAFDLEAESWGCATRDRCY